MSRGASSQRRGFKNINGQHAYSALEDFKKKALVVASYSMGAAQRLGVKMPSQSMSKITDLDQSGITSTHNRQSASSVTKNTKPIKNDLRSVQ